MRTSLSAAPVEQPDVPRSSNLLWWEDRLWFIDFPQAVDIAANPLGLDHLHRDVANVCEWFARRGVDAVADEVFASLITAR